MIKSILVCLYSKICTQQTNFEYFTTNPEGLSQSVVTDVMEDSKGYLWISTHDGLNQFDGDVFKRFYREDGLHGHEVECAVEGKDGEIWVATRRGLNCIINNNIVSLDAKLEAVSFGKNISELIYSKEGVRLILLLKSNASHKSN